MKLFEEFKEYEELWTNISKMPSIRVTGSKAKVLKEARSVAEIEAEIAKLKLELEQAKIAEKNMGSQTKVPTVWVYDIYSEPSKKGTWTSLDGKVDIVYETREKAIEAATAILRLLDNHREIDDIEIDFNYEDKYTIDAFEIPVTKVSSEVLRQSNLKHLIPFAIN
jgi:hypothetical protein